MPILLLHGQPGRGRDWQPLIDAIGDRALAHAFDRPGWDGASEPAGISSSAAAARRVLDQLGWERATIVGHSYGAAVAAWLASESPERIDRLVLVAPAANSASLLTIDRFLAVRALERPQTALILAVARGMVRSALLRRVAGALVGVSELWLRAVGPWLCEPAVWRSFFVEQRLQMSELRMLDDRLGEIRAPTEIVIGTSDPTVPFASAQILERQIPGAHLTVIRGGRHTLPAEVPARLAEIALGAVGPRDHRARAGVSPADPSP